VLEAFSSVFGETELEKALKGIDIIGDLAVIKLPRCWEDRGKELGELVLNRLNHVRGVFRQTTPASRGERLRGLEWLAGCKDTVTTYREHGCMFKVDIAKVYFSPRLSYERLRIARLARGDEVIVNMFAGVGTFSIVIAKVRGAKKIYSIDSNGEAFKYMGLNSTINKCDDIIVPMLGDSRQVSADLKGVADRILMPLPELACDYIPFAVPMLRKRGWIHVYTHERANSRAKAREAAEKKVGDRLMENGELFGIASRVVRSVGSRQFQIATDAEVEVR
jgi:tRNA (guanine37-N1)-methyltransferase